jgi:hypothetical protein
LLSNVTVECTGEDLRQWIEGHGYKVFSVDLIKDEVSGTSPSFAYAQLADSGKIQEAAGCLHGQTLLGRTIHVCQVVPLGTAVKRLPNTIASA